VQKIALKLTSVYETSSQDLNWGICVTLPDNHGYSSGIIQFTTGMALREINQQIDGIDDILTH
jgi:hypothetical protein